MLVVSLFLMGAGVWQASQLAVDAQPDVTNTQVVVSALATSYGPEEMEQKVTFPMEIALASMNHLDHTESISQFGLSQITCYFDEQIDIYEARHQVAEQLQNLQGQLPPHVNAQMDPVSTGLGEIYHVRIVGGNLSLMQQRSLMDWTVRPQLLTVPGIADMNVLGGEVREFQVVIDPQRLMARGLTVSDVNKALDANNQNNSGKFITQGREERLIRGVGLIRSLDDVSKIVVGASEGVPITVAQIATVQEGAAVRQGAATENGQGEQVFGIPLLRIGANTRVVMQDVKKKLKEIEKQLPSGAHFEGAFERTALIENTLHTAIHNLIEGGVLVIVVLFLFLLQIRAGLIVSAIIPLAMLFAIVFMKVFSISANLMSLGAIDFGMIVDGAVIIVENSVRRLAAEDKQQQADKKPEAQDDQPQKADTAETPSADSADSDKSGDKTAETASPPTHGKKAKPEEERRHQIIYESAVEVLKPSVFGIIIILATYLPILSLSDVEGKMFRPMGLTVMFALTGSLLFSLTLIPALCAYFLKNAKERHNYVLEFLSKHYRPAVEWAIDHKWVVTGVAVGIVGICGFLATKLGSEFVPTLDENNIAISVYYAPSASLPEMIERSSVVEGLLLHSFPDEITKVLSRIGRPAIPTDPMLTNQADVFIALAPRDKWKKAHSQEELTGQITKLLDKVPGFSTDYTQPIKMRMDEMIYGQGMRADFGVKVLGPDMEVLRQQGGRIAEVIQSVSGAEDVKVEQTQGLPQLQININRNAIARYGISAGDINTVIETALGGYAATTFNDANQQIDVTVRYAEASRDDPRKIGRTLVPAPGGAQIPLSELAEIKEVDGPVQISRENERRRLMVNANVRGRDLGGFVTEAQRKIEQQVKLPTGYSLEFGGTYESLKSGRARLLLVVPIALTAILLLLLVVFGRMRQALIIFTGIPLAISGGILALLARHMHLSMTAAIGFIALGGIALLNGLVMVSFINDLREQGKNVRDAVLEGAQERLRPVLMTGTVASIGFIPMAVSSGLGAEVQRPLATVVIGGLITSTLLTLFVLPTLYAWFEKDDSDGADGDTPAITKAEQAAP